jgi:hypothetical protein
LTVDGRMASVAHRNAQSQHRPYKLAVARLLKAVHRVNSKELTGGAAEFDGVM